MNFIELLYSRIRALVTRRPGRAVADDEVRLHSAVLRLMTQAGVSINADNALSVAVVWACVTYLGRTVGQLPWRVMRETAEGKAERVPNNAIDYLLSRRPNPEMGAFTFRETMVGWAALHGNAVAEIQFDARNMPIALWPINPRRGQFERDPQTSELMYRVTDNDGSSILLPSSRYFHLRGYGEGPIGLSVVQYAAESIGWTKATELFGSSFFGNGINPSGIIEVPGKLSPDALALMKGELKNLYAGPRNASKTVVLDSGMKFSKLSVEPDAAQFIETRQHQVDEICRWFGVPPHKVMHLLRATFSNIEHQSIEVVADSIVPWCKRLEEEADYKLFGGNRQHFFTKLDTKGLMRGDFKSRQEGLLIMRRAGIINGNEWRRLEDMNEIGALGEKYIVEANMTTLDRVGEAPPAEPPLPHAEPSGPTADDEGVPNIVRRARQQASWRVH